MLLSRRNVSTHFLLFGLVRSYHHLGDKVDDGAGGLFRVVFGKQVTDILCAASAFPCDEAKDPVKHKQTAAIMNTFVYIMPDA